MQEQKENPELPVLVKHVLNTSLFKEVYDDILNNGWYMNNMSSPSSYVKFWTQKNDNRPVIDRAAKIVHKKTENILGLKLNHIRTHYNGQTFGQNGSLHTDYILSGFYTFLLYCNIGWDVLWGGETVVIDSNNEIKTFNVSPNTGVLFPSNWGHFGKGPSRECLDLRISLAFSFCIDEHFHKVKDGKILPEFLKQENAEKLA